MEWLEDQWNRPGLTEHYLMVVASEVNRSAGGKSSAHSDYLLQFTRHGPEDPEGDISEEEMKQLDRATRIRLGLPVNEDPPATYPLKDDAP